MATYYGLRCRTCETASDTWIRTYPEVVADLVKAYPAVRTILRQDFPYPIEVTVTYLGVYDEPPHNFLADHYAHDLVVYDEYGRDHPEVELPQREALD